jgi:nitroimidazol reductase NimA-like FMN-containing flavoprotein (pyridoxamine 5'-phosphate oxidase superfamily)
MNSSGDTIRTERTSLRRKQERGAYDRKTVNSILDDGFVCHMAFVDHGQPLTLPTIYGRDGDRLLIHGSRAGRMLRTAASGLRVCVTVTLLDGLVLARSARMHSVNYRSVVIVATAVEIFDPVEKTLALRHILEHVLPGRWEEVRPPTTAELKETSVLQLPIKEGSAKIRKGPPIQVPLDSEYRVWSGEVPLKMIASDPIADARAADGVLIPSHLDHFLSRWAPAVR